MAAWISSTGLSPHNLLAHAPSGCVPEVSNRPHLGLFPNPCAPAPSCSAFLGTHVQGAGLLKAQEGPGKALKEAVPCPATP